MYFNNQTILKVHIGILKVYISIIKVHIYTDSIKSIHTYTKSTLMSDFPKFQGPSGNPAWNLSKSCTFSISAVLLVYLCVLKVGLYLISCGTTLKSTQSTLKVYFVYT